MYFFTQTSKGAKRNKKINLLLLKSHTSHKFNPQDLALLSDEDIEEYSSDEDGSLGNTPENVSQVDWDWTKDSF